MASPLQEYPLPRKNKFQQDRRALYGIIAALMVSSALPAYGQATLYTSRPSFQAAVPGAATLDLSTELQNLAFEGVSFTFNGIFPNPSDLVLNGVTFQRLPLDPGGADTSLIAPAFASPYQGWNGNPTTFEYSGVPGSTLVITLPPGTLAAGMDFYTIQSNPLPFPAPIDVYTGNLKITLSNGQTITLPSLDKPGLSFFGFTSATPITSITIFPPLASATALANGKVDLANFAYSIGLPPLLSCPAGAGTVSEVYASSFVASSGAPPYVSFGIASGSLPPGLMVDQAGNVTGIPTAAGTFAFTGSVADSLGLPGTVACNIVIAPPPPVTLSAVPVASSNGTQVLLTWNYGGGPIDGFIIQRKPATLSAVLQPLGVQTAQGPAGPQFCPAPVYVSGLLSSGSRCLIDTVQDPYATYTYQLQVSGGVPNATAPSNLASVFQLRKTSGTGIDATFSPATGHTVQEAAQSFNFDHFSWISIINHDPQCYINSPSFQLHAYNQNPPGGTVPAIGAAQFAPHLDPPYGGYAEYGLYPPTTNIGPSDGLPYYWDEQLQWALDPTLGLNPAFNLAATAAGGSQIGSATAEFKDTPFNPCLPGNGPFASGTEYWGFVTTLVGVRNTIGNIGGIGGVQAVNFTPLASFAWNTTNNGTGAGANGVRSLNLDAPLVAGTGGVFNVVDLRAQDLPLSLREILIQAGGQNISSDPTVDTAAPTTAAFLLGPQSGAGSYTGPVTVTLIATDVNGPVASTSYSLDGGSVLPYSGPFIVSTSGAHTIVFGSTDQAMNVETPRPSISFSITGGLPALSITGPATLSPGMVASLYGSVQFTATGGSGTGYSWIETGPLPTGVNFSSSGLLSGTPAAGTQGVYNPQFKVTDSASNSATVSLSLTINMTGGSSPLSITGPATLSLGMVGNLYGATQFAATGGSGTGYSWTETGSLPMGVSFSSSGLLSGTPAAGTQGVYNPQFKVTDSASNSATINLSLTINIAGLSITGPATLSPGTVGSLYGPVQFAATGGSGTGYSWTETGSLPMGVNFSSSGLLTGTPAAGTQGSYNPQFKVTDSASNSATVSLALTINPVGSALPPSISSISPSPVLAAIGVQTIFVNGSAFQSGAGLKVHLSSGLSQIDLTGAQVTFFSSTQLSIQANVGTATATWTATVTNPDNQSSNVFSFTVQAAQVTSFAVPQFTFGGGWYTALYFANTTNLVAHIQVNFSGDAGAPLLVPLLGIGSVTSQSIDIDPFSTVILEAPNSSDPQQEGWAEVALPTGVTGYAVLRQTVSGRPDQEAVVPFTPESSTTADLTYDDILFTTSVAFLNPTAASETVTISTFDTNGAAIASTQVVLNPRSKIASTLKSIGGLAGIAGNRGRAVFSVISGAVSVLGLRFGGSAFTSIAVVHRPATPQTQTISFALPQFVFSGGWYTALYFSNTTNTSLNVPMSFVGDNGAPLPTPLLGIGSVTSQTVTLSPGATSILEAPANAGTEVEGWVNAAVPPGVNGYAVFRQTVAGRPDQEAVVPLTSESSQAADLVYDDVLFTTAVAFVNPSNQQTTVTITVYSATGSLIGSTQVVLAPQSKVATVLKNLPGLSGLSGNRGLAEFSVPNGDVSVLGLRFGVSAFTSIPVNQR